MSLSDKQVREVAHLARLAVNDEDVPRYAAELSNILDLVGQLEAAPTEQVAPMAHPLDIQQRLRPDAVTETDQRDRFQAQAPSTEGGMYLVPRVIE
ncbi:MAG: Asp-tRNA(Asn)/Glu-tRNA(Gln) amidotransferase subunit GatC [Salinisphaeraceae bacterium]|nr:Asp-tRNA(Asn)/Glu-tRNA(Gln) amidotransferase subunit GatC [Salinisphaeraceae bacterium]